MNECPDSDHRQTFEQTCCSAVVLMSTIALKAACGSQAPSVQLTGLISNILCNRLCSAIKQNVSIDLSCVKFYSAAL